MSFETPTFAQLSSQGSPLVKFAILLFSIFVIVWAGMPIVFDPPVGPVHVRLIVLPDQSCNDWEPIVRGRNRLPKLWDFLFQGPGTIVDQCTQAKTNDDLIGNPQDYIQPGEAMALLDSSRAECGSDEARSTTGRRYLILCSPNPATYDQLSWMHEGWHIALGHTALRHTFVGRVINALPEPFSSFAKQALNTFLDIAYVGPTIVLRKSGAAWLRLGVLFAWVAWWVRFLFGRRVLTQSLHSNR